MQEQIVMQAEVSQEPSSNVVQPDDVPTAQELCWQERIKRLAQGDLGQGTTEYAILVGVLVVIAILAIVAFRGKVQELWDAITSGINSL